MNYPPIEVSGDIRPLHVNSIGIPVVFIGTNSMIDLFSNILRNARRVSGQGLFDFKQPTRDDTSWGLLLDAMWKYQWVKRPAELSESLKEHIYDQTQGITDFLAKLMILGQRHAIQSGKETLDENVFRQVAATKMKLLQPALAALRSNDPEQMRLFDDLLPTDVQLAEMMKLNVDNLDSRIAVLRQKQESLYAKAAANLPSASSANTGIAKDASLPVDGHEMMNENGVRKTVQYEPAHGLPASPVQRPIPLSAKLAIHTDTLKLLREANWIMDEPFEFEPAYLAA